MDPPGRDEAKRAFGDYYADGPLFRRTRHANRPNGAQSSPPGSVPRPAIRRPSIAGQDAFFAQHPEYRDPGNRHAPNTSPNQSQEAEPRPEGSRPTKRGRKRLTKNAEQADTIGAVDAESSEHSFDSLFDERPAKKARHNSPSQISEYEVERLVTESRLNWANQSATIPRSTLNSRVVAAGSILNDYMGEVRNESRHVPGFGQDGLSDDEMPNVLVESEPATPHVNHSQSYQGTATPSANVTLSGWVMETNELLLAQRTRLHFALNNSATRLGRQLSSEEVSAMQRSLENIQRAVSELEMEAARHDLL